jgi:hypothetical protein
MDFAPWYGVDSTALHDCDSCDLLNTTTFEVPVKNRDAGLLYSPALGCVINQLLAGGPCSGLLLLDYCGLFIWVEMGTLATNAWQLSAGWGHRWLPGQKYARWWGTGHPRPRGFVGPGGGILVRRMYGMAKVYDGEFPPDCDIGETELSGATDWNNTSGTNIDCVHLAGVIFEDKADINDDEAGNFFDPMHAICTPGGGGTFGFNGGDNKIFVTPVLA